MRTAVKKNARRQELLEQIYPMIDQVGYESLTVRGICTSLGISTGTFYHYFPEKADLLLAFFAGIDDFYQQEVLPRFGPDEAANLDRFIHSYGVYCQRVGAGVCRCLTSAPAHDSKRNYLSESRPISQILEELMIRGAASGRFTCPFPPEQCARMVMISVRGHGSDWAKRGGEYDLIRSLDDYALLLRIALGCRP